MTIVSTNPPSSVSYAGQQATIAVSTRDPRLDFYRGLAMFIILIAHIPSNFLTLWIPARFGFSDATEIFVFCSGMASAIAFGRSFERRGWWLGTARVAFRAWQVYWAHISTFIVIAALMAYIDNTGLFEKSYIGSLNLVPFFENLQTNIIGLLTLTYVPNYFDILPMYIIILLMMPIVIGLKNINGYLAILFVGLVWLAANMNIFNLPAEPWSTREWFFNPFGWQLVFFTGFAFMSGWFPAPPLNRSLIYAALAVVVLTVPLAYFRILQEVPALRTMAKEISFLTDKTDFGLLRYTHFLALAYLAWAISGDGGKRLITTGTGYGSAIWRVLLTAILKVGQQSLAVFVFSMVAARMIGFILDQTSRTGLQVWTANLIGFCMIIAVAYTVGWFKSQPWRKAKV